MSGALEKLPGVTGVVMKAGDPNVVVRYDPTRTDVARVLAGLQAAGEPAKAK